MRSVIIHIVITLLGGVLFSPEVMAWELAEHKRLGDSVFTTVIKNSATVSGDIINFRISNEFPIGVPKFLCGDKTFGDLCAFYARHDDRSNRYHDRGRSILDQLRTLKKNQIDSAWTVIKEKSIRGIKIFATDSARSFSDFPAENVIGAYLLHHLMALRLAESAAGNDHPATIANDALIMESVAQGYLADAFSSGHMLVPLEDHLALIHPRNNREAHDHFRNQGVYVINSQGRVWQTFGDKLMHYYSSTYDPVFEACRSSLLEVLAVLWHGGKGQPPPYLHRWLNARKTQSSIEETVASWLEHHDGSVYYADRRLPTLLLLPMPVAASWSYRTDDLNEPGQRRRYHFPQLREDGYHDPDMTNIDAEFLYPRSSMPEWLIPDPLRSASPITPYSLITSHPDWASVRWVQHRYAPPSYKGLLTRFGLHLTADGNDSQTGAVLGIGYGLWDDLILFKNLSIDLTYMPSVLEPNRSIVAITAGGGLAFPFVNGIKAMRTDIGLALGTRREYDRDGALVSFGFDSEVHHLKFTNVGITLRVKYQLLFLERTLHGPSLELVFQ